MQTNGFTEIALNLDIPGGLISHICIDSSQQMYLTDFDYHVIFRVKEGITEIWGGSTRIPGSKNGLMKNALFNGPRSIIFSLKRNCFYVSDGQNYLIRKIDKKTEIVSSLCGSGDPGTRDGSSENAEFTFPCDLALDKNHSNLFVTDAGASLIRKIDLESNEVSTLNISWFKRPRDIILSPNDPDKFYVCDTGKRKIAKFSVRTCVVNEVVTGEQNEKEEQNSDSLERPFGMCCDVFGNLYVADFLGSIWKLSESFEISDKNNNNNPKPTSKSKVKMNEKRITVIQSISTVNTPTELPSSSSSREMETLPSSSSNQQQQTQRTISRNPTVNRGSRLFPGISAIQIDPYGDLYYSINTDLFKIPKVVDFQWQVICARRMIRIGRLLMTSNKLWSDDRTTCIIQAMLQTSGSADLSVAEKARVLECLKQKQSLFVFGHSPRFRNINRNAFLKSILNGENLSIQFKELQRKTCTII